MILMAKKKRRRLREQTYGHQEGKGGMRWDELGDWDGHVYTTDTMYRVGN